MATSQTEIESRALEFSAEALKVFCEGISGMFGVNMQCNQQQAVAETVTGLGKHFKKLVGVDCIQAEGAVEGTLQFVFDREGLFALAGIILSMPEQKTLENTEHGSLKDAEGLSDAIGEIGHLMAGAWQRVFNEKLDGQSHFVKTSTFIGDPWDKPEEKIGLAGEKELLFVSYEITIEPYPTFKCGVIFPETIFAGTSVSLPEKAAPAEEEAEEKAEAEIEERAEEETEEKAAEETEEKTETEAQEKAEAEAEEKGSDANESATEEKPEASAEEKDAAPDANAIDDVAEEESAAPDQSETEVGAGPSVCPAPEVGAGPRVCPQGLSLTKSAEEIMQKEVVWGSPDDSVQQALAEMQRHDAGYMMIGRDGALEGIVSKSDLTGAISPYLRPIFAKWRRPSDEATLQIKIKWIMSRPVRTIKPQTSLAAVIENMRQFGGRCLPVVDRQGNVHGLVTVFDILKVLSTPDISSAGKTLQVPPLA